MLFNEVLNSIAGDGNSFRASVSEDWGQGRAMFGGIVAAIGNEALRKLVPRDRPLRSLQTTFVGPAPAGTMQIKPRVLRVGKAVTIADCDIVAADQVVATVMGVYGGARPSAVSVKLEPQQAPRAIDECREVSFKDGAPQFIQHFAVRWSEGAKPFSRSDNTPTKAYIRHRDPGVQSESHIIALIDCIPTPAMSMFAAPAPASSLVWTLDFVDHRFDFSNEAWWRIDTTIDAAGEGYVNQTGVLLNPDGQPAALTRQLFAVFG